MKQNGTPLGGQQEQVFIVSVDGKRGGEISQSNRNFELKFIITIQSEQRGLLKKT